MGEARGVWERVGGVSQVRNGVQVVLFCWGERWEWVYIGGAPKLAIFDFSAQKPVEPFFQKAAHSFLADRADWQKKVNSAKTGWTCFKTGWTCFHQTKTGWVSGWTSIFQKGEQCKNRLNLFFQKAILAKIDLKRLYYILSLSINKGKLEVLDQGFWALVPTPTFFFGSPLIVRRFLYSS
jgi:hypothetical protein